MRKKGRKKKRCRGAFPFISWGWEEGTSNTSLTVRYSYRGRNGEKKRKRRTRSPYFLLSFFLTPLLKGIMPRSTTKVGEKEKGEKLLDHLHSVRGKVILMKEERGGRE